MAVGLSTDLRKGLRWSRGLRWSHTGSQMVSDGVSNGLRRGLSRSQTTAKINSYLELKQPEHIAQHTRTNNVIFSAAGEDQSSNKRHGRVRLQQPYSVLWERLGGTIDCLVIQQ